MAERDPLADPHCIRSETEIYLLWEGSRSDAIKRTTCGHCGATARRRRDDAREWFIEHECRDEDGRPVDGKKYGPTLTEAQAKAEEERLEELAFWRRAHSWPPDLLDPSAARVIERAAHYVNAARRTMEGDAMNAVLARLSAIESRLEEHHRITTEIAERLRRHDVMRPQATLADDQPTGAEVIDFAAARRRLRRAA